MPAPAARRRREPDEPWQGGFTQPKRHLLLDRISTGSEVSGQILTCFSQRGSSPECGFFWKPPGAFLLENSFSRRGSFDARAGSTAGSSYAPGWSCLSPHPAVPLAVCPLRPRQLLPRSRRCQGARAGGTEGDGRLSDRNSPATGQRAGESCCCQHPQSDGVPGSCEAPGEAGREGACEGTAHPAPGQPSCSIRKALNTCETIQTSQVGAMSKAPAVWGPSRGKKPVFLWHQQVPPHTHTLLG